ncbi:hypothetical protein GYMLUDRAFT_43601 [Collybiopsis luxurians FD-317 M1]|uniref:Uncharacterized protein n=1 Tax=Collybiopsis luxurians FD-317 M1 TaxID=944289 RepID=A0A0D0CCS0_9AGAR|nr:hypothetical protein GYMLUDRAFT_43601 [Collybiopsis luxurians FD-317 M1]
MVRFYSIIVVVLSVVVSSIAAPVGREITTIPGETATPMATGVQDRETTTISGTAAVPTN